MNECSAYVIEGLETKEFDLWFNVISPESRKRLKVPCKKTPIFNTALQEGILRNSFKIVKKNGEYYITVYVNIPRKEPKNEKVIGIDVGLNNAAVTSDGKVYGKDIRSLRIRTKWRKYKRGVSAIKQTLNRTAKEIVEDPSS